MRYYIIAGEPSGDLHGSKLLRGIRSEDAEAKFRFTGGDRMAEVGGKENMLYHYKQMSFFGFVQVAMNLRTIFRQMDDVKADIERFNPDYVVILSGDHIYKMDYADMLAHHKKGDSISYGRTFTAPRDMKVATLPIGYADGLFRALSKNLKVLINGKEAPIIGRICMDQCMVDVTGLDVKTEDEVTVFGAEKSVYELSDAIDTIPYEIICDIGKRVPRVYIN